MLTGRTPYVGDNFAAIFDQHLSATPPRVREFGVECPAELEQLIVQLLAKSPDDRPFNARAVQGILGELIADVAAVRDATVRGKDRAAASVRPIQLRLRDRIRVTHEPRDVSWRTLGFVSLGVLALIVAMCFLRGKF